MRAVHAFLALLLTAPVLGASALDPPEAATTPPPMATDDTCLAAVAPQSPPQVPCVDVPLLVDEGGDTMTGDLRLENGAGLDFATGGRLAGISATSLRYGARAVCLASVTASGCGDIEAVTAGAGLSGGATSGAATLSVNTAAIQSRVGTTCAAGSAIRAIAQDGSVTCETDDGQVYTGIAPITVGTSTIGLSTSGCVAGEAWLWSGTAWSCSDVATQSELDAVKADVAALESDAAAVHAQLDSHAATLTRHQAQLNQHGADLAQHQQQLDTLSGNLAAHKTSGDHDARYSLDSHGHDVAWVHTSGATVSQDTTVLTATVAIADECPGGEQHRLLVTASASPILTSGSATHLEGGLAKNNVALARTWRQLSLYSSSGGFGVLHTQWLGLVDPGESVFTWPLHNANPGTSVWVDDASMVIQHLGWTCS